MTCRASVATHLLNCSRLLRVRGITDSRFPSVVEEVGMSLRLVNWNVEWATPRSWQTTEILSRIDRHAPEVVCLTETRDGLLSQQGHMMCSQPDYGYTIKEGWRKVMLWSRQPWEQVDDVGSLLCRPDGSCPASHKHQWARSPLSGSVFPGSDHGLRLGASWNARCRGRTMNSIWPVSLRFSDGSLPSV